MPGPPALSCERIPFAPTAPDDRPIDTKEGRLEIVSEQAETEVAGVAMAAEKLDKLSRFERDELDRCEAMVANGLTSFVTVGNALAQIRDLRLYREEFGTFEDYCRERWDLSRAHAYRLVDAAGVAANLSPIGDMPTSESQVRLLARLEPEQQREAWARAVSTAPNGNPTGARVAEVVAELCPAPAKRTSPKMLHLDAAHDIELAIRRAARKSPPEYRVDLVVTALREALIYCFDDKRDEKYRMALAKFLIDEGERVGTGDRP
jgi:hypothetical protein